MSPNREVEPLLRSLGLAVALGVSSACCGVSASDSAEGFLGTYEEPLALVQLEIRADQTFVLWQQEEPLKLASCWSRIAGTWEVLRRRRAGIELRLLPKDGAPEPQSTFDLKLWEDHGEFTVDLVHSELRRMQGYGH